MGYHTVALPSQVDVTSGQQFVVAVKVTSPGASYPIAVEYPESGYSTTASADAGQSFISSSGTSWSDLTTAWNSEANVCLKAYVTSAGATEYTLNTSVVGNGSIGRSPDQTTYAPGTEVTLTATPAAGWRFNGWSGNATGSTNPLTVTMNANKTITATFIDTVVSTRYEQTNSLIAKTGTWSAATHSSYSAGSLIRSKIKGNYVTVAFEGTELTWIASTGAGFGIARLTLDGGTSFLVDLYSRSNLSQQEVYSTGPLSAGTHTLKIECAGVKNASALYTYVNIDAFDVVGTLVSVTTPTTTTSSTTSSTTTTTTETPTTTTSSTSTTTSSSTTSTTVAPPSVTRYEQTNSLIAKTGTWSAATHSSYSAGSLIRSKIKGNYVTVAFEGTELTWIASTGAGFGIARLTLDGGTSFLVDLYSRSNLSQQEVYSTGPLSAGTHTLKIECAGVKNASALYTYVNIDAFDVVGTLVSTH